MAVKITMLLVCILCLFQHNAQAHQLTPEEIKKQLIEEQKLRASSKITKVKNPQSKDAEQIIIIKSTTCQSVAKVFKDFDTFLEETKALDERSAIIELINEMRLCHKDLPIITAHKSSIVVRGVGTILLERAKGKTLNEAYLNHMESLTDQKIKEVFTSIGKQFGTLDKVMHAGKKKVLVHGDGHGGNFLYDEKNSQLYWIDNGAMEFTDEVSGIEFIPFLGELKHLNSTKKLSKLLASFIPQNKASAINNPFGMEIDAYMPFLRDISASKLSEFKAGVSKLALGRQKELLAIKSFKDGYLAVNPAGKAAHHRLVEDEDLNGKINKVEKAVGLPQTLFPALTN